MLPLLWTLICFATIAIWAGVASDSFFYWYSLRSARPALASAYGREVVADGVMCVLSFIWSTAGVLAVFQRIGDHAFDQVIQAGLFAGPVLLLLLGLYRFWRGRKLR